MADKTKIEAGADRAKVIAEAIEGAIAAWSPIGGLVFKGLRKLRDNLKKRGQLTPEEEAEFDDLIAEGEGFIGQMETRGADYRRRRDAEKAGQPGPLPTE